MSADLNARDGYAWPRLRRTYEACFNTIGKRIGNLFENRLRPVQLYVVRRCPLKDLLWPVAMAFERVRERAVSFLDEARQIAQWIGKNLVDVRRHDLNGVQLDAELFCEDRSRVPVDLL